MSGPNNSQNNANAQAAPATGVPAKPATGAQQVPNAPAQESGSTAQGSQGGHHPGHQKRHSIHQSGQPGHRNNKGHHRASGSTSGNNHHQGGYNNNQYRGNQGGYRPNKPNSYVDMPQIPGQPYGFNGQYIGIPTMMPYQMMPPQVGAPHVDSPIFTPPVGRPTVRLTNQNGEPIVAPHVSMSPIVPGGNPVPVPMSPHVPIQASPRQSPAVTIAPVAASPAAPTVQKAKGTGSASVKTFQEMIAARLQAEREKKGEASPEAAEAPAPTETKTEPVTEVKETPKPVEPEQVVPEAKAPEPKAPEPAASQSTEAESAPIKEEAEPVATPVAESEPSTVVDDLDKASPAITVPLEDDEEPTKEEVDTVAESVATSVDTTEHEETSEKDASAADADRAVSPGTAADPQDDLSEIFTAKLDTAERASAETLASMKYPVGTFPNNDASPDTFRYGLSFLLQFQSVVPPVRKADLRKIVNIEAGKGRSISSRSGRQASLHGGMRGEGRMSRNASVTSMHGMGGRQGRNNSRRKGDRQNSARDRESSEPAVPLAPLVRGENAWVPRSMAKKEPEEEEDDRLSPEEVQRRAKSLLNKMTLENFSRIADQVIEIAEQSKRETDGRTLRQVIELTFEKAVDEPHWSAMYAAFCAYTTNKISVDVNDESITDGEGKPLTGPRLFRRYLLTRCQQEFEKGWSSEALTDDGQQAGVMSDEYYAAVKAKRRGLGLIRFIGELYKTGLLSGKIIISCLLRLGNDQPTEDIVESLCKLLITVAVRMEHDGLSEAISMSMNRMNEWRTTAGFPARLRFMIMDVEDARKNQWKTKEADKGPKTLAQIHIEAEREQKSVEEEKRQANRFGGGRGGAAGRELRDRERQQQRQVDRERQKRVTAQKEQMLRREASSGSGRRTPVQASTPPTPQKDDKPVEINRFSALDTE